MSRQFRRSVGNRFVRVNFTKTGVSLSVGVPGARRTWHSGGSRTRTVGIPGTGTYWREQSKAREGEKGVGSVAQRFHGRGVKGFLEELMAIEQDFLREQSAVARTDPADVAALRQSRATLDSCTGRVLAIYQQVADEKHRFIDWGRGQTKGFFGAMFGDDYMAQIHGTASQYDELLFNIEQTLAEWNDWLRAAMPTIPTADGTLVLCPSGHENHVSRSVCLVCGASL